MNKQETLKLKRNYEKHSLTKTKGYKLWCNIIQRCYNPKTLLINIMEKKE